MSFDEDPRENDCPACNEYEKERIRLEEDLKNIRLDNETLHKLLDENQNLLDQAKRIVSSEQSRVRHWKSIISEAESVINHLEMFFAQYKEGTKISCKIRNMCHYYFKAKRKDNLPDLKNSGFATEYEAEYLPNAGQGGLE